MRACNDFADRGKLSWMLGNWRISQKMGARARPTEEQVSKSLPLVSKKRESFGRCLLRRQLSVTRCHRLTAWIPCLYFNRTCNFPRVEYTRFLEELRGAKKSSWKSELNFSLPESFYRMIFNKFFSTYNWTRYTFLKRKSIYWNWNFPPSNALWIIYNKLLASITRGCETKTRAYEREKTNRVHRSLYPTPWTLNLVH